MADKSDIVDAGEPITATPPALALRQEEQFRHINQRLDELTDAVAKIPKPPTFRVADTVQSLAIVVGLVITGIAAFGLSERMTDLGNHGAESERRVDAVINATEARISSRLDALNE